MSQNNRDFHVPNLGPADRNSASLSLSADVSEKSLHTPKKQQPLPSGGGWFQTIILVLLTAACSGLGYVGFGLQQTVVDQQSRITDLENRLNLASDNAAQSGQTLEQRLNTYIADASSDIQRLEASVAEMNKARKTTDKAIMEQVKAALDKASAQQSTDMKGYITELAQIKGDKQSLVDAQKALADKLTAIEKQVGVATQLKAQLAANEKDLKSLLSESEQHKKERNSLSKQSADTDKSIKQQIITLQTQLAIFEETLNDEQTRRQSSDKGLADRLQQLEKPVASSADAGLSKRVTSVEQAIRAIDGSRRQVNTDILNLKQQINALQLRIDRR